MAPDKVVDLGLMRRHRDAARSAGKTVVLTNGCFDIIHPGHVAYLEAAALRADFLYVGVNSDPSVRALKGSGRPFNRAIDRAVVVGGLAAVQLVAIFEEETAVELVRRILPDFYVKGGDYSADPTSPTYPIEGEAVTRYGGVVEILPFLKGYSTTELIRRIREER